jgi:hypothetical protein
MTSLSAVPSASPTEGAAVQIGSYTYSVVPQRIGRLKKRLGRALGDLESLGGESLLAFVDSGLERAHDVLKVFIPDLMPAYEFLGYRSQDAMDADEDEEGDYGPTLPDIVNAFEVVMRVNRLDLLGHLRSVISPELLRAYISSQAADLIRGDSRTTSSASSASTNGAASESTISGTTPPTSELSVA